MPLIFLLFNCSAGPADPGPIPPAIAAGTVCVDVTPAEAEVRVNGTLAKERCVRTETQGYTHTIVEVTASGFEPQKHDLGTLVGEQTLEVELKPAH